MIRSGRGFDSPESVEMAKSGGGYDSLDKANQKRRLSKQQALDRTLCILAENPDTKPTEVAALIGKSRQTIYDYLRELETMGKIHRNGSEITVAG